MIAPQHIHGYPEPAPVDGDIVLRSCDACSAQFELCPNPAPPQIRCRAYLAAVDMAKRWACHEHVDVWVYEGERSFALVSRHRRDGTSVSARMPHAVAPGDALCGGRCASVGRPNALLIGSQSAAKALMAVFRPHLIEPIAEWDPAVNASPPPLDGGTLVVWNADAMSPRSQTHLLDFIRDHRGVVQVISMAHGELFDRVEHGEFLDDLYYCLNVIRIRIDES